MPNIKIPMKSYKKISLYGLAALSVAISACKKDGGLGAGVIEICDKQETELRLKNHKSGVDYRITCDLNISDGKLIVEPGVTIAVDADKIILVGSDGAIQVQGTASEPVTFQATESVAASWGFCTWRSCRSDLSASLTRT